MREFIWRIGSRKEAPTILRRRRVYQGLESFSQRAVEMRKRVGVTVIAPNVPVKKYVDCFDSDEDRFKRLIVDGGHIDKLPDANRPPGFFVNGEPITADNFLFFREWDAPLGSSLDKLSAAELAMMIGQVKLYCKTMTTNDFLEMFQEVLNPLYDAHVDLAQSESYEHQYAIVESTTNLNLVAKNILYNALLRDAVKTVADKLIGRFPRHIPLDLRTVISWVATYTVFLPFTRPHGLIAQWGLQRIKYLHISSLSAVTMIPSIDIQISILEEDISQRLHVAKEMCGRMQSAKQTDPVQVNYQEDLIDR